MLSHAENLRSEVPDRSEWVDSVRSDWHTAELSAREGALCNYAAALTRDPGTISEKHLEPLREAGLDDRAILDLAHVIGFFAYANRLVDGLGCGLEPEMEDGGGDDAEA